MDVTLGLPTLSTLKGVAKRAEGIAMLSSFLHAVVAFAAVVLMVPLAIVGVGREPDDALARKFDNH